MAKLIRRFAFYLRPKPPYNFRLSIKKPAGWDLFTPNEVYENGVLWTAMHIDGMLIGLKLRSTGDTEKPYILVDVFMKNALKSGQKIKIKEALAVKLAIEEDLTEFYSIAKKDPILKHTIKGLYGMHDTDLSDLFASGILAITLQMAPMKRSDEMMNAIIENYGETAEFEGKRIKVWPIPERIANVSSAEMKRRCKLGYRAKYIVQLARIIADGKAPSMEELRSMPPEDAKERLLELPGIGDYSADIINPYGGFPIDVWSADVFGKLFYGKEPKNGRDAVEKIKREGIRRWGEWSWMAFFYVVQDLKGLSKKLGTQLRLS